MTDCAFCNNPNVQERIITENEEAFVFPTNTPIVPGHLLIIPKRHITYYEDLSESEKASIEDLRGWSKSALQRVFTAEGFNYAWNEEEIGGQSVPHFHLHVVPRKKGDVGVYEYEPRKFLYRPGTRAETPQAELLEVVELLRTNK